MTAPQEVKDPTIAGNPKEPKFCHRQNLVAGDVLEVRVNGTTLLKLRVNVNVAYDAAVLIAGTATKV